MPVISLNLKMTALWFARIFFSFFPAPLSYTSCGCYCLSSVLNLVCVTLILQWKVKSASPSSLPHPLLTSPIHLLHSLLFALKSVMLMEFVWEGVEPPLLYPSPHLFTPSQPPSQSNMSIKRYQTFPPQSHGLLLFRQELLLKWGCQKLPNSCRDSWGSLSGKEPCGVLALYLGAYFTSAVAHLFL